MDLRGIIGGMPVSIIPTKILIPRRTRGVIHRARLVDFLHENLERKLLLITAPAGYGKTTLLIDFAADSHLPVCWYTLDENDRDPAVFLAHLVASLQQKFPRFGARTSPLIEHGVPAAHAAAAALVADMVADAPEYFVLVLDDWHLVSDEAAISDLLDHLLRYLPEHAHLIVAGRTLLRGPLVRLAAQGAVAGIGPADLRFTSGEVREVLASRFNLEIDTEQASRLATEAEGWITAILLSSHGTWQSLLVNLPRARDSAAPVYEYLASEVFDRLTPTLQDFLLTAAVPRQFSCDLVNGLRQADDAEQWIDQIEARNLFLTHVDVDGKPWYRFHPLFRDFLLARFNRTWPDRFREMQWRAGQLFESRHQPEEAVEHYLIAGALEDAARLMNLTARQLYINGRRQTLQYWYAHLPARYYQAAPELLLFHGRTLLENGQFAPAVPILQQAEASFQARNERLGELQATLGRGWADYARGKYLESLQIGLQVLQQIADDPLSEQTLQAEAARLVGDSDYSLGHWSAAEGYLTEALAIYRHALDDERRAYNLGRTLQDLANVLRSLGRLEVAASSQAEALTLWRQIGNPGPLARCLNNLGYDRYVAGDYEGALKLYAEALNKAEEADDRQMLARVLDGVAAAHRDSGDSRRAIDMYQQAFNLANEIGDFGAVSWVLEGLGHAHRLIDESERALSLFEQALGVAERQGLSFQVNLIKASIAITQVERGQIESGLIDLQRIAELLRASNSYLDLGRILLWLARAQALSGQNAPARNTLTELGRLEQRLGCRPFSLAEGQRAYAVLLWGAGQLEDRFLKNWLDTVRTVAPSSLVDITVVPVEPPVIKALAFGPSQVWRDGQLLTSAEWGGSALARELVFYLLEQGPQRKEEIGAIFWPDQSPGRMTSSFHAAKYRIRRALNIEFAVFEDDSYSVNPAANIWYDVAEFRRLLASARSRSSDDPDREVEIREALQLYSGHYLTDSYAEWAVRVRDALQVQYFDWLDSLLGTLLVGKQFDLALSVAQRGLELDYYQEELHQAIMQSLVAVGQTPRALAHYDKMSRRFSKELNTRPSPETQNLARKIRADHAVRLHNQ